MNWHRAPMNRVHREEPRTTMAAAWPPVDVVTTAKVIGVDDVGLTATLPEYGDREGCILFSEVSRHRIDRARIRKLVGKTVQVKVLRVDAAKGFIDLSIRRTQPSRSRITRAPPRAAATMGVPTTTLNTGDVVLFYDSHSLKDRFLAWGAGAPCSHVGMVVRNPPWLEEGDREGVYLLESGYEGFPDAEDGQVKFGVQLVQLDSAIANYGSPNIHVRRLIRHPWWTDTELAAMHALVHNKPYDTTPEHWAAAFFHRPDLVERTDERYWCSALVTRLYVELGMLPAEFDWTAVSPAAFEKLTLPLLDTAALGPIEGPLTIE